MTSISTAKFPVKVTFLDNASSIYGSEGLAPSTEHSAGTDLRACLKEEESVTILPGERKGIPSGIAIEPGAPGIAGFIYSRSGLGAVKGLTVAQGVGVIDPDYRGEIVIFLLNTSKEPRTVSKGERIAQLVFLPFLRPEFIIADALGETERGAGGFGHTGSK